MNKIEIGLCTISFNSSPLAEALSLCAEAGTKGIELWGRAHLPINASVAEIKNARRLADQHGLSIVSYGAYARPGTPDGNAAEVKKMLEWTPDLGASVVRVWAGNVPSAKATPADWNTVVSAFKQWGDWATAQNLRIVVERHSQSLTDFGTTALDLIERVNHPNVWLNYQKPFPMPQDFYAGPAMLEDLRLHLPVSRHIHAQNTMPGPDGTLKRARLADGLVDYSAWRPIMDATGFEGWAMLEFLPETDDVPPAVLARQEMESLRKLWKLG